MANVTIPVNEMNSFDLPKVCVISGAKDNIVFKDVTFRWVPPWARLFGVLIQALVARKANGQLPFTEEAHARYKASGKWMALGIFGMIVAWMLAGVLGGAIHAIVGLLFFAGSIALPIMLYIKKVKGNTIGVARIDSGNVELKIPSDPAANEIMNHLRAGKSASRGARAGAAA
jgi:hypothetical protein